MLKFYARTRRFRRILLTAAALCAVLGALALGASCKPPQKKAPVGGASQPEAGRAPLRVSYFFDKTESMQGFAAANSDYVTALDAIWTAESLFSAEADYYGYGPTRFQRFEKSDKKEFKKTGFYAAEWRGENVHESGGQAFGGVKEFINKMPSANNALYIITSDLYEQNAEKLVFSDFFRAVFENGMSGALFAVESRYTGNIFHEASGNSDDSIPLNGTSLFFILVAGNGSYVRQYHAKLREDFKRDALNFESWFFNKNENYCLLEPQTKDPQSVSERKFNSEEYKSVMVNLRADSPEMLGLYETESRRPAKVTAYRIITKQDKSRYVGFLPKELNDVEFKDTILFNVEFCNLNERKVPIEQLEFKDFNKDNFKIESVFDEKKEKPALAIIINNTGALAPGIYRVKITSCIKAPQWIEERSVTKLSELKKSLGADRNAAKVLNLEKVFEDIAGRYVSSGEIYFVKKR